MAAETARLPGLQVVQIRYQGSERALPGSDPVDAYSASGAYERLGEAAVVEPEFVSGYIQQRSLNIRPGYLGSNDFDRAVTEEYQAITKILTHFRFWILDFRLFTEKDSEWIIFLTAFLRNPKSKIANPKFT